MSAPQNPPRHGEGDRPAKPDGGGPPAILTAPIKLVKRARHLRRDMSLPEVLLWQALRKRPGGHKFRRRFTQAGYVLDFACLSARVAIEVDGEAHNRGDQPDHDAVRDQTLMKAGFTTLRIPASDVLRDLEAGVAGILATCRERGPLHHSATPNGPPPRPGEDFE
jgi:very-short-patch-repair endonuclease